MKIPNTMTCSYHRVQDLPEYSHSSGSIYLSKVPRHRQFSASTWVKFPDREKERIHH